MTNFEKFKEDINKMSVEDSANALERKVGKNTDVCFGCPAKELCESLTLVELAKIDCAKQIEKWLNMEVKR